MKDKAQAGTDITTTTYGIPLEPVTYFKYIGRFLLTADNDWSAVVHNLWRERQKWAHLSRVLSREGTDDLNLGSFYVAMVLVIVL